MTNMIQPGDRVAFWWHGRRTGTVVTVARTRATVRFATADGREFIRTKRLKDLTKVIS